MLKTVHMPNDTLYKGDSQELPFDMIFCETVHPIPSWGRQPSHIWAGVAGLYEVSADGLAQMKVKDRGMRWSAGSHKILHNHDVIMSAIASQITGISIVCSAVCSGADQRKHKFRVTGLYEGNPPVTGGLPSQRVSNAENVFIWWCHHVGTKTLCLGPYLLFHRYTNLLF